MARRTTAAEQSAPVEAVSRDREIVAAKRAKAAGGRTDDEIRQDAVDALLAERRGYVQRDLGDRVGQVDEQLKRLGRKV